MEYGADLKLQTQKWNNAAWTQADETVSYQAAAPGAQFWYLSTKAPRSHWDAVFHAGDYLVFGPESRGLPESMLREHADTALTIPMPGEGARSLNLSTAVAVVLYEGLRQTGI